MDERYSKNIGAITEEEQQILLAKKVFVAGCGGLGGHIINLLLRVGIGEIRCADGDIFCESNLNRQLLCFENNIGMNKAEAAVKYASEINSSATFIAYNDFISEENVNDLLSGCDIVIDALDNIASRKILKSACDSQNIPYVYGSVQGWIVQAAILKPNDNFLDTLYSSNYIPNDKGILAPTPSICASLQVSLCIKYLCNRRVEYGRLYFLDMDNFEFQTINFE